MNEQEKKQLDVLKHYVLELQLVVILLALFTLAIVVKVFVL